MIKRLFMLLGALCLFAGSSGSVLCVAARPIVLVFETSQGEGASRLAASAATKAIRTYLRETQRVEATIFERESPAVTRAILERKITPDQVASYSSEAERRKAAEILGFAYACGSEITIKEQAVSVKIWVAKAGGRADERWDAVGQATSSGAGEMDINNAVQSAASGAVNAVARKAFAGLPVVAQPDASADGTSGAIEPETPGGAPPSSADLASDAERNLRAGNIALAIQQYGRAVDADPTNPALRLKLAEAYSARGMFDEAESEIQKAQRYGASEDAVTAARDRLKKLRSGEEPDDGAQTKPVKPAEPPKKEEPATSFVMSRPDPAVAKIVEGDKLWGQGKPDEAADAYREAIKLNPRDWRAWERLAVVNASMSLFVESRRALESLRQVQPSPNPRTIESRYDMLRKAFDKHFTALLNQYDENAKKFTDKSIARENYYNEAKGLALRLEAMAKFLDTIDVPESRKAANTRRSLACGLMAQAAASLTDFLETNSNTAKSNAAVFASQARKELQEAERLEAAATTVNQ